MNKHLTSNKLRRFVRTHRGITAVIVIVVSAGIYTFWSVNAWMSYATTTERRQATLHKEVDAALALPMSNSDERSKKTDTLRQIADTIEDHSEACQVNALLRWQEVFPSAKEKKQTCSHLAEKVTTFGTDLHKLIKYLENDQQLTDIMVAAATKKTLTEGDFEMQVQLWQRAVEDVRSMQVEEVYDSVREVAMQSATTIYEAWQKLYDAHKAEDATAYDDARGRIADAYDTMASVAAVSTRQFRTLANSLQATYDTTF